MKLGLNKNIKLLIFVKSIDGGTGTFLINLLKIKRLFKDDHLTIRTLVLEKPTYRKVTKKEIVFYRKENYYPEHYSFSLSNIFSTFEDFFWLNKQLEIYKPTIILSVDARCNIISLLSSMIRFLKLKVIVTNHIDLISTLKSKSDPIVSKLVILIVGILYKSASFLVSVSKGLSQSYKNEFGIKKNIKTIYNGIDSISNKSKKLTSKDKIVLLSMSRLVEQKDYFNLLDSFKLAKDKIPNLELWILGDGPMRGIYEKYSNKLQLKSSVKFFGWVEKRLYMLKSDVFILSSKREGLSYSIVEAMSYGLPIISTNSPFGPSEVLDNGKYGILVPVGDCVAMSKAIINLVTVKNKYNYFSEKSIERSSMFSNDSMLSKYAMLIRNLSNQ